MAVCSQGMVTISKNASFSFMALCRHYVLRRFLHTRVIHSQTWHFPVDRYSDRYRILISFNKCSFTSYSHVTRKYYFSGDHLRSKVDEEDFSRMQQRPPLFRWYALTFIGLKQNVSWQWADIGKKRCTRDHNINGKHLEVVTIFCLVRESYLSRTSLILWYYDFYISRTHEHEPLPFRKQYLSFHHEINCGLNNEDESNRTR